MKIQKLAIFLTAFLLLEVAHAAILVDINADGTSRNASTADFEAAAGLAAGTLNLESVIHGGIVHPHPWRRHDRRNRHIQRRRRLVWSRVE